ncbi:MBL fold metallo-hydrolase [Halosimplex pelagicum]|uniref:MBL fold metallo-hydrolase n=1 Tax=Halosimplex pelagicum TaxID=869886 RepID=A0A7D5T512_9EURY|nr:MBL fold metallo-hydrolase [Halosimplex pelagicum]QLH81948.1 MBL fold metallo-hydrolase [Halosimplex pelagicum]
MESRHADVARVDAAVETRAPTGETAAYVLGADPALLVDPAARTGRLDDLAAERDVGHVAVTHHHPDHVGAVAHYAEAHDATVWARTGRADAFEAATGVEPDRTFAEGTAIETGEGAVHVVDTPGHAPEHVGFLAADGDGRADDGGGSALVCGDLAVAEGSVVVGAPEGDLRAYLSSLRRVHAMAPDRLLPGHGPAVEGVAVRETTARLLAHRLDRERRVREAVAEGWETVPDITTAAYDKDLSGVRDLAEATVRAHLEKLAVEGSVRWDGDRARPA